MIRPHLHTHLDEVLPVIRPHLLRVVEDDDVMVPHEGDVAVLGQGGGPVILRGTGRVGGVDARGGGIE